MLRVKKLKMPHGYSGEEILCTSLQFGSTLRLATSKVAKKLWLNARCPLQLVGQATLLLMVIMTGYSRVDLCKSEAAGSFPVHKTS